MRKIRASEVLGYYGHDLVPIIKAIKIENGSLENSDQEVIRLTREIIFQCAQISNGGSVLAFYQALDVVSNDIDKKAQELGYKKITADTN